MVYFRACLSCELLVATKMLPQVLSWIQSGYPP